MRHLGRRALVFAANDDGTVVFDSHGEYRDAPIDFAARCSMSIPYFVADPRHEGAPIYDGGLLNNFPVDELVRIKGDSNFVGLYLKGAQLTGLARALTLLRIVRILLNRDERRTVEQYRDQTVIIDPAPIRTTQFSLSDTAKDYLIAQGRAAALALLARDDAVLATEAAEARQAGPTRCARASLPKATRGTSSIRCGSSRCCWRRPRLGGGRTTDAWHGQLRRRAYATSTTVRRPDAVTRSCAPLARHARSRWLRRLRPGLFTTWSMHQSAANARTSALRPPAWHSGCLFRVEQSQPTVGSVWPVLPKSPTFRPATSKAPS
jgi:hypothetical protein